MPSTEAIYTPWEIFWYYGGFFLWAVAYALMLYKIWQHKFVELPAVAVCGNITWEILYAFVWKVEMLGDALQWLYRAGTILDCVILIALFRYGHKQVTLASLQRIFKPALCFGLAAWTSVWYGFVTMGYDLPLGSNTAYIIQVVMSVQCILLILRMPDVSHFSYAVGALRGLGTGMVTVFVFMQYSENYFVQTMGVISAILDTGYMITLWHRKHHRWGPALAFPSSLKTEREIELRTLATAAVIDPRLN